MKTALLLTGQYRSFDTMYKYINNNFVIPNDATIFIYGEHFNEKDFENKFNENNLGTIKILKSCKTSEYNTIFKKINTKNFPELEKSEPNLYKYLQNTGQVLEYFQIMKCHQLMEEYEQVHNFKFDIVIKCRLDSSVAMPLYISNFFSKINVDLLNKYGPYIYKISMGNEKLCAFYETIYGKRETNAAPINNHKQILQEINNEKCVWTFHTNMIWIFKRHISDKLCNIIYKFGCWEPLTSETQFVYYLQLHKIPQYCIFTKTDEKYTSSIKWDNESSYHKWKNNHNGKRLNDFKELTFDEPDLFLIRIRNGLPPWT